MSTASVTLPELNIRPTPVRRGYEFELVKLLARWPIRVALLACWLGPALLVAVISQQSTLPSDTVFGRWMGQTGWAGSLVVLTFSGTWVLPLLTSLVAGDIFAHEDRLGTWRHLLVAVRAPRRIFAAKALASLTVIVLLVAGLAVLEHRRRTGGRRQPATGRARRPSPRVRGTRRTRCCSPG